MAKRSSKGETRADALTVAASAGAAALVVGHGPAASAVLTAATAIPLLAAKWCSTRRERRWLVWVEEYIRGAPQTDPELLEARLHAEGDDPVVQEVIVESARAVDECLEDAVVPAVRALLD